jgi:glycosyltransferase involved in cell wall biosynthesis
MPPSANDTNHPDRLTEVDLTVVLPCLNEAESLPTCLGWIAEGAARAGLRVETVLADNGSTDPSRTIAVDAGARVAPVAVRGYGAALAGGIAEARAPFIVMGDADGSYDFRDIGRFYDRLVAGADLVQGCRLPSGGGAILPGAMPWLHRWLGNPALSRIARRWFRIPIHDIYCGMRAFRRDQILGLGLRSHGMEFATEMIIKASLHGLRIDEIPITLHPDKRRSTKPHLRTFRDGWRTLRFFLLCSPRWLFLGPGIALSLFGALLGLAGWLGASFGGAQLDLHSMVVGMGFSIVGVQGILFAYISKVFAIESGLLPADRRIDAAARMFSLERGLILGAIAVSAGVSLIGLEAMQWARDGFGSLNYASSMRIVIPAVTMMVLGVQAMLFSFFLSLLGMGRR